MRQVVVKDDLDHSLPADETVELTFDGVTYRLDLCAKNATKLRNQLNPWLEAAHDRTKVKGAKAKAAPATEPRPKKGRGSASPRRGMRAWLAANGWDIPSDRNVPIAAVREFDEAHGLS